MVICVCNFNTWDVNCAQVTALILHSRTDILEKMLKILKQKIYPSRGDLCCVVVNYIMLLYRTWQSQGHRLYFELTGGTIYPIFTDLGCCLFRAFWKTLKTRSKTSCTLCDTYTYGVAICCQCISGDMKAFMHGGITITPTNLQSTTMI